MGLYRSFKVYYLERGLLGSGGEGITGGCIALKSVLPVEGLAGVKRRSSGKGHNRGMPPHASQSEKRVAKHVIRLKLFQGQHHLHSS